MDYSSGGGQIAISGNSGFERLALHRLYPFGIGRSDKLKDSFGGGTNSHAPFPGRSDKLEDSFGGGTISQAPFAEVKAV